MNPRIAIVVGAEDVDVVSGRLWASGCLGVEELARPGGVELRATFADETAALQAVELLGSADLLTADDAPARRAPSVITRVGSHVIHPPEVPVALGEGEDEVVLEAIGVFGDGGHPTTRLVLDLLVATGTARRSVLDVGAGTGVVALVAAREGATAVTALEIDDLAAAVARSNVERNGCGHLVDVVCGDAHEELPVADVAVANLTIDEHERVASRVGASAPIVLATGILDTQVDRLLAAYPHHRLDHIDAAGEWRAVRLIRIDRDEQSRDRP